MSRRAIETTAYSLLIVLSLVFLAGCATLTGQTAGEHVDDATINAEINALIIKDPDAQYLKIDVTVIKGDVVLNGFVSNKAAEDRLVSKISGIRGVKSVKSLLKIEVIK